MDKLEVQVEKRVGHGEGGRTIPKLTSYFDAIAADLQQLFGVSALSDGGRNLRGSKEEKSLVTGVVTDSISKAAIVGATVMMHPGDVAKLFATLSVAEGKYGLKLWAGKYTVLASAPGYVPYSSAALAFDTANKTSDVALAPYLALVSSDPEDGEVDIAIAKAIAITFSRAIASDTKYANILLVDAADEDETPIAYTPTIVDAVLTITPDANLDKDKTYKLVIPAEAVKATSADAANLEDDIVLEFTTVAV